MQNFDISKLRVHAHKLSPAEQLVGFGFRCWLTGYQTNDISCWGKGWDKYSTELGAAKAKPVVTELAYWVQTVKRCSQRTIDCAPIDCKAFCQDECTAISLIAASQHQSCPALQACACALLGTDDVEDILNAADSFAHALHYADVKLEGTVVTN